MCALVAYGLSLLYVHIHGVLSKGIVSIVSISSNTVDGVLGTH